MLALVPRFLKVVLQFFLRFAPALADGADLLRRWRGMGVQMPVIARRAVVYVVHNGIVPLDVLRGKSRDPLPNSYTRESVSLLQKRVSVAGRRVA